MLNHSETSQPILFAMLLQLERMFLQLLRHAFGFQSLMMLAHRAEATPPGFKLIDHTPMVLGAMKQRY